MTKVGDTLSPAHQHQFTTAAAACCTMLGPDAQQSDSAFKLLNLTTLCIAFCEAYVPAPLLRHRHRRLCWLLQRLEQSRAVTSQDLRKQKEANAATIDAMMKQYAHKQT